MKYEWKRHNGSITYGRQSSLFISRATLLDGDQYYCVAMTEGGYGFSNNVTLTVNSKNKRLKYTVAITIKYSNIKNMAAPDYRFISYIV